MKSEGIGLKEESIKGVTHILNENLCDEYVLTTKTRNYHWNVTGPEFGALHELFEKQYGELDEIVDEVAERVRAVGGWTLGTLSEFSRSARIQETPGRRPDAAAMVAELAADHESVVRRLRNDVETCQKKYRDEGTANFLAEVMARHEKMAWMLRAHLRPSRKQSAGAATARAVDLTDDPTGAGE